MPSQAERLHEFLQKEVPADKKIHLVGCSMGGMLAGVGHLHAPEEHAAQDARGLRTQLVARAHGRRPGRDEPAHVLCAPQHPARVLEHVRVGAGEAVACAEEDRRRLAAEPDRVGGSAAEYSRQNAGDVGEA
ncbi:hypothetical protein ON010_g16150 [Phytophthora cinnamomi]|nr:hypothetical protein ON010_g16150 [Phytophthora cinnamomi]